MKLRYMVKVSLGLNFMHQINMKTLTIYFFWLTIQLKLEKNNALDQ